MKIEIRANLAAIQQVLKGVERQLPFAVSLAVNRTAQAVKAGEQAEMRRVFDRPTPYTLNSLQLTPGKKADPQATVWFKPLAERYIGTQVSGGGRPMKRSEQWLGSYWVPGAHMGGGPNVGNLLDAYGNVRGGMITEILAYTGTHPDLYSRLTERSMVRNKRWRKGLAYFIEWKDGRPIGVMRRIGKGDPRTVLHFIKAPAYQPRFDFFGVGQRIAVQEAPKQLQAAIRSAIETAIG